MRNYLQIYDQRLLDAFVRGANATAVCTLIGTPVDDQLDDELFALLASWLDPGSSSMAAARLIDNEATAAGTHRCGQELARRLRAEAEPAAAGRSLAALQMVLDAPMLQNRSVAEFEGAVLAWERCTAERARITGTPVADSIRRMVLLKHPSRDSCQSGDAHG